MDNNSFETLRTKMEGNTELATLGDLTKLASALLTANKPAQSGHNDHSRRRDTAARTVFMMAAKWGLDLCDGSRAPSQKDVYDFITMMRESLPRPVKGDVAWPNEIGSQKVSGNNLQIKFFNLAGGRKGISVDSDVVMYAD